jgi:O-antigen ligase
MRTLVLWFLVVGLGVYAWRDWFKALCGLILLMAVIEHPDMPNSVFGIQGLNPWNLLLLDILLAWSFLRRNDPPAPAMPGHVKTMLFLFLLVIVSGFFRMIGDLGGLQDFARVYGWQMPSVAGLWSEYFINPLKWVLPGLLLFDGCRSRSRFTLALVALLGVYFVLAIEVLRWIPVQSALDGGDLSATTVSRLRKEIGYHRTDLSVMLAGASWAMFSTKRLFKGRGRGGLIMVGCLLIFLAQMLTAGRGGYMAWVLIGLLVCLLRYRKYLLLVPPVVAVLLMSMPGLADRITTGFRPSGDAVESANPGEIDANELSAGRSVAWPLVLEKIAKAPVLGYGREAMKRIGLATTLLLDYNESAPHPHNAYLETLLDNGLVGFMAVVPLFLIMFKYSLTLYRDRTSDVYLAAGGVGIALIGTLLIGSLTGQTFYPREASVGAWCAIGLTLRVYVNRAAAVRLVTPYAWTEDPAQGEDASAVV